MSNSETQVIIQSNVVQANISNSTINADIVTETVDQSIIGIPGPTGPKGDTGPQGPAGSGSSDSLVDTDGDTTIKVENTVDEDQIRFETAGVERMVVNANGNIGIGTNPAQKLHINGNVQITEGYGLRMTHSGYRNAQVYMSGTEMRFYTDTGGTAIGFYIGTGLTAKFVLDGLTFAAGSKYIRTNGASDSLSFLGNSGVSIEASLAGGSGDITFHQNNSKAMVLDSNANLGLGPSPQTGGGSGIVAIANAATVPTVNPTGGGILYVEDGALKFLGSSGTVTTIAAA